MPWLNPGLTYERALATARRWKRHFNLFLTRRMVGVLTLWFWVVWAWLVGLISTISPVQLRFQRSRTEVSWTEILAIGDEIGCRVGPSPWTPIGTLRDGRWFLPSDRVGYLLALRLAETPTISSEGRASLSTRRAWSC